MASRPTIYTIAVAALICLHCQNDSPLYENAEDDPAKVDAFLQKTLLESNHHLLRTVHGPPLQSLIRSMTSFIGPQFTNAFLRWLEVAAVSLDAFMDLMGTIGQALLSSPNTPPLLSSTSTNGMYLRSVWLGFEELSFDEVSLLWSEFTHQVASVKGTLGSDPLQRGEENMTNGSPTWQLAPTQMEAVLQQEIQDLGQSKSWDPQERQSQLEDMLDYTSEVPSAHFLRFLYALENGDRQAAIDALHHYLDIALAYAGDKSDESFDQSVLHFAAILSAAFWDAVGDRAQSLAATEETIRVAQQSGNAACVAFALGWLGLNGRNSNDTHGRKSSAHASTRSSQELIRQCVDRAAQNNLRSLQAGASLVLAIENHQRPAVAWDHLSQALTENQVGANVTTGLDRPISMNHLDSGSDALEIVSRQQLVAAGLWDAFGQTRMSEMSSKALLLCHADKRLPCDFAVAIRNLARCSLLGFSTESTEIFDQCIKDTSHVFPTQSDCECVYLTALQKIAYFQELYSLPATAFRFETMLLLHEWSVRRCNLLQAEKIITELQCLLCPRLPNYEEVRIDILSQKAELLSRQGKWDDAKALIADLVDQCKSEQRLVRRARLLLQLASIHLESAPDQFSSALPYLLECLTISEEAHMLGIHASALTLLGQVQLRMHEPRRALATIRGALSSVLQNEHVWIQGEAYLTVAECQIQLADAALNSIQTDLFSGIKSLQMAIKAFEQCHDFSRLKKAYYLLARSYDRLPTHIQHRDAAAEMFVQVSRYLVEATGPTGTSVVLGFDRLNDYGRHIAQACG